MLTMHVLYLIDEFMVVAPCWKGCQAGRHLLSISAARCEVCHELLHMHAH